MEFSAKALLAVFGLGSMFVGLGKTYGMLQPKNTCTTLMSEQEAKFVKVVDKIYAKMGEMDQKREDVRNADFKEKLELSERMGGIFEFIEEEKRLRG